MTQKTASVLSGLLMLGGLMLGYLVFEGNAIYAVAYLAGAATTTASVALYLAVEAPVKVTVRKD